MKTARCDVKRIGECLMDFSSKIAINKGWSDDKKYCVTDQNQQNYFLRISEKKKLGSKK